MSSEAVERPSLSAETRSAVAQSRHRRLWLAIAGVLAALLVWETLTRLVAYTDDAEVRSDLVAVAPQVTGHVVAVHVSDNQSVRRGDPLVSIDPEPFRLILAERAAALREAVAQVAADPDSIAAAQDQQAAAAAALQLAQETKRGAATLNAEGFASAAALDAATAALRRAQADRDSALEAVAAAQQRLAGHQAAVAASEAALATAQWRLDRTEIPAPVDGAINNLTVRVGDTAAAETPLVGVVDAQAWRIVANYKQDVIRRLRVGGLAWVWLDTHPWHFYRARIQGIGRAISRTPQAPGLLPYVAPTTDWIRLQRRFPVTLVLVDPPPDLTLYMGADARSLIFP